MFKSFTYGTQVEKFDMVFEKITYSELAADWILGKEIWPL